jgi:hypothetical protein
VDPVEPGGERGFGRQDASSFWVAQNLVVLDQSRSRCRTRDELARSVNQDVMLTCVFVMRLNR